ncbi:conjugative transposon protein TraK [Parabacteroides sp. PF5-9]|uniref:conjugative transposon protein TraK n=1 Tax=Parabacteroides sp. PF5-9 TaxID=1742404 RepID=UPI0024743E02|nr:conjugative transposon protein TraK [Parabacteroides sp. PF5-9]MDH6358925.1 conjugative transposon TraK protein [Parabacteroides sp. PF5-9]
MLIEKLENKIKLALTVSVGSFLTSIVIIGFALFFTFKLIINERKHVYVLDAGVPILVQRTNVEENAEVEAKSHVSLFHSLFFTLPPDDEYINENMRKAMYLIDESGLKQYNNLKEQGYYRSILANSMLCNIKTDSVLLDISNEATQFTFYGTQRIERATSILKRKVVTTGFLRSVNRSDNNPHGLIITNWKTLLNEDIDITPKKIF